MAARVFFNEVNTAALGAYATVDQNWRDAPQRSFSTVAIPGRHGVIIGADPTMEPRRLRVPFELRPAVPSTASRLTLERQLVGAASRGLVQITFDDDVNPPVAIDGLYESLPIKVVGHELQGPVSRTTVQFLCPDPTWRDVVGQVVAFNAEPQPIPVGTAPGGGRVRISAPAWSANVENPVLTYYAASGAARWSLTFTTTLTAGTHYLDVDLDRVTATLYASGVASNAIPLLSAGDFGAIDPLDADALSGSLPLLGVTASAGTPAATWLGTRRWL